MVQTAEKEPTKSKELAVVEESDFSIGGDLSSESANDKESDSDKGDIKADLKKAKEQNDKQ